MYPYLDLHCDTLLKTLPGGRDLFRLPGSMLDVERLGQAGALAQFFAVYLPPADDPLRAGFPDEDTYFEALRAALMRTVEAHPERMAFAASYADLVRNRAEGKLSALLTIEDGRIVDGSLEKLRHYYGRGVRLITLTWNFANCFGWPGAGDPADRPRGLTAFGAEAVEAMNGLGMLIDVSHLSDGGFYDVARLSKKPFVASHSNCRAISPHPRNLTDDMLRLLAERGGVAGLNFCGKFLNADITCETSTAAMLAAHAAHMVRVGGEDCAAIGTDFDGIHGPLEIGGPEEMYLLFGALAKQGFTERQIEKLASGNALRVLRDVL